MDRACKYTYVSGIFTGHKKKSDVSCQVIGHSAQRCSKCGNIVKGETISVLTYKVCPH